MKIQVTEEEQAALEVLRRLKAGALEAALVAKEALEAGRGRAKRAKACIRLGAKELKKREKTVCFGTAVEAALEARKDRRKRTQQDFRYICRRLMKRCGGLAKRRVRGIAPQECERWLHEAFGTPRQFAKGRAVMSAVFGTAMRRGWCGENPLRRVEAPRVAERRVPVLTPEEIGRLLKAAAEYDRGSCLPAVGVMLYAGIRPHEAARLTWEQIDLENKTISIEPRHSKTGGARLVTIHPSLLRLLQPRRQPGSTPICPVNWPKHWRTIHKRAGWGGTRRWIPDILRHTFATYHLKYFRSYTLLQFETGHRNSDLLRTRYVNMQGTGDPKLFWNEAPRCR